MGLYIKLQKYILILLVNIALSACGGSGGGASNNTNTSNIAPTISGSPTTLINSGQTYSFTPITSDANNDALIFSIINLPGWASFNPNNGELYGITTSANIGTYNNIQISVSDGTTTTTLLAFSITINPSGSQIKNITINWNIPTTYTDGSNINSINDIGGYRIYSGTNRNNLALIADINNPNTINFVLNNLISGTHYFSISSYDNNNIESSLIAPISINI